MRKNKKVILANAPSAIPLKAAFCEAKQTQYEFSLPSGEARYTQCEPKNTSGEVSKTILQSAFAFGESTVLSNSKSASCEAKKASSSLSTFSALGEAKALYSAKSQASCEVKALSSAKSQASSEVKGLKPLARLKHCQVLNFLPTGKSTCYHCQCPWRHYNNF